MARSFWRTLATACAATAMVAGPTALAASAAPPTPDAPTVSPQTSSKVSPEVLRALQRDLGLTAKDATKRLAFQSDAASTEDALAENLDAYAGAWVDPGRNRLYVGVADGTEAKEVRAAGATPVVVDYTLAELDAWKVALDGELTDPAAVPSWYVDVTTNQVVVNVHDGGRALAERAAASAGVPADAVTYVTTTEAPRPLIDVVGGNAYTMGSGGRCSVGFAVNGGFVTAGHCGTTGTRTSGPGGTFRGSSFPGNDYAWVQVDAGNTPVGAVNNYSGGRVAVAGSTAAPVGSSVCRSGSTTGWRCGTIAAYDSSVTYPQGTVSGLIRTNVCAEPGDSGGSLVAGNQAQGLTSGGSGNCSSGGTTYFQPVNEALSAYGLTLVTSGGGGTEPPPVGCAGYARSYQGSVSAGASVAQPNGSYVTVQGSGVHRVCLSGPAGSDLDLYLQKWSGSAWANVASSTSPGAAEALTYTGTAGYYRYVVHAYAGSGAYTLGATTP